MGIRNRQKDFLLNYVGGEVSSSALQHQSQSFIFGIHGIWIVACLTIANSIKRTTQNKAKHNNIEWRCAVMCD